MWRRFREPTTPEGWAVTAVVAVATFFLLGCAGFYFAWLLSADKPKIAESLVHRGIGCWVIAAAIAAIVRVARDWL